MRADGFSAIPAVWREKNFMLDQDQIAKWIIGLAADDETDARTAGFLNAARLAWPRALAHARRELSRQQLNSTETASLALEIWESVLRSVWKTFQQRLGARKQIEDLENYFIGAFHHRLNRHLKQKRQHDHLVTFVPPEELIELDSGFDERSAVRIHQDIQLKQAYATMDPAIRRAIIARVYGFSWREIARTFGTGEQNLIMRVQYAIRKLRDRFDSVTQPAKRAKEVSSARKRWEKKQNTEKAP